MNDIVIIEAAHHVHNGIDLANVGEELVAEPFALTRAFNEARDIYKFDGGRDDLVCLCDLAQRFQSSVRHLDDAHVGIDRAKRIVCRLRLTRARQGVKECAFAHVGETYNTSLKHSREKMPSSPHSAMKNGNSEMRTGQSISERVP